MLEAQNTLMLIWHPTALTVNPQSALLGGAYSKYFSRKYPTMSRGRKYKSCDKTVHDILAYAFAAASNSFALIPTLSRTKPPVRIVPPSLQLGGGPVHLTRPYASRQQRAIFECAQASHPWLCTRRARSECCPHAHASIVRVNWLEQLRLHQITHC